MAKKDDLPASDAKRVMIVVPHVWLPIDRMDPNWSSTSATEKVEGRDEDGKMTRLDVSASLADFLAERRQVEILE